MIIHGRSTSVISEVYERMRKVKRRGRHKWCVEGDDEEEDGGDHKVWRSRGHTFSLSISINFKCHIVRAQGLRAPDSSPSSYPCIFGTP